MRFLNAEILKVIRQAMEQQIKQELSSKDALAAYQIILLGIDELQKREVKTSSILKDLLPEGESLLNELNALRNVVFDSADNENAATLQSSNQEECSQAENYNTLLADLDRGTQDIAAVLADSAPNVVSQITDLLERIARWECAFYDRQRPALDPVQYDENQQAGVLDIPPLQDFIARQLNSSDVQVSDLQRIPGGMSKETYFFTLDDGAKEELVVRKVDPQPALEGGIFDLRQEYALVKALYSSGFKVPEPKWLGYQQPGINSTFYISERAKGGVAGSVFGAQGALPEGVLLDLAKQMAYLHTLPMTAFEDYVNEYETPELMIYSASQGVRYYLDWWHNYWKTFQRVHSPAEVYLFDWLYRNIPENNNRASLIHGDFSLHNFLYEGDEITAVLDWEGSHFGDPAEDLAYARRHVSQHLDWSKFLAHYNACGGPEIDQSTFAYYDCLANTRNLIATNKGASRIKFRDTNDTKDLYLALEYIPEFMQVALKNIDQFNKDNNNA